MLCACIANSKAQKMLMPKAHHYIISKRPYQLSHNLQLVGLQNARQAFRISLTKHQSIRLTHHHSNTKWPVITHLLLLVASKVYSDLSPPSIDRCLPRALSIAYQTRSRNRNFRRSKNALQRSSNGGARLSPRLVRHSQ